MYLSINVTHEHIVFTTFHELGRDSQITRREFPSKDFQKYSSATKRFGKIIADLSKHKQLEGIALSIAGYVDPISGEVLNSYSFRDWDGKNIRNTLAKFNCPVKVENDAVVAALGQYRQSQKERTGCVYFARDAGIGAAVINPMGDKLLTYPVELGHIIIVPDGRSCECGQKGCLEQYVAGRGVLQTYGLTTEGLHDEEILVTTARYLTQGLMTLLVFYPLDTLYLTGQNMRAQHEFLGQMAAYTTEMLERKFIYTRPRILVADIEDNVIDRGNLAQFTYSGRITDMRYSS